MSSSYTIRIKDSVEQQQWLFEKTFDNPDEFHQVVETRCIDRPRIGCFESLVITVRTDTLRNFCEDFFLPTFIHHAMQINDMGTKIIMGFTFLILDICTLPIRIITLLPRYYANAQSPREAHPLHQYLTEQGAPAGLLNRDFIQLQIEESPKSKGECHVEAEEGTSLEIDHSNDERPFSIEQTFNFIDLPENISPRSYTVRGSSPSAVLSTISFAQSNLNPI